MIKLIVKAGSGDSASGYEVRVVFQIPHMIYVKIENSAS